MLIKIYMVIGFYMHKIKNFHKFISVVKTDVLENPCIIDSITKLNDTVFFMRNCS